MQNKNNYFRRSKSYIDEEDRESINEINNVKKYSKGTFYTGAVGLGIAATIYLFSGDSNFQILNEPFNQMNNTQLVESTVFSLSSLGLFGGGVIYGLSSFIKEDQIKLIKKKIKGKLEKKLKN